ncbi:hypothetical protein C2E23DRAFT_886944 [Lenzites betulinus]|nr:hypothetical protein C2E23DRAFT_886944 [Lenzites betulinus]
MESESVAVDPGEGPSYGPAPPVVAESQATHDIQPELQLEPHETPVPEPAAEDGAQPAPAPQDAAVDAPDCHCWPHSKESLKEPHPPERIFRQVRKIVGGAIQDINTMIERLRALDLPDPKVAQQGELVHIALDAFGQPLADRFDLASLFICQAPGYLFAKPRCRNTFSQHLVYLSRRDDTLRTVEETLKQTLADAQPLFEARDKFMKIEATRRRRRLVQMAAVMSLPFAPVVSATLSGLDTLVLAIFFGAEDIIVPEEDLRSTSASVDSLLKEMTEKIGMVEELRGEIALIRKKVTMQEGDPAACRLSKLVLKLQEAHDLAETVIQGKKSQDGRSATDPAPLSLRDLVAAVQEVVDVLGEPHEDALSFIEVDGAEWAGLDEKLKSCMVLQSVSSTV